MVEGRTAIGVGHVARTLEALGIDGRGLGPVDRGYLAILRAHRRPMGIAQLSTMLGVDATTLAREHEPYLLHLRLVAITQQGRLAL